jgi:hypothetical protein
MMERRAALLALFALFALFAGCYSPRAPEGAPCQSSLDCPTPQRCIVGHCSTHDAPEPDAALEPDAAPPVDAAIDAVDASPDAAVLLCATTGLSCGGTATTFLCGGHCWVKCTANVGFVQASQACAGWMGALGAIETMAEQGCVEQRVSDNIWIGLRQDDAATAPAQGWNWNTPATPVVFTHWQAGGIPDDADGRENRNEQCAKMQGDGTWDDIQCGTALDFLCER